MRVLLLTSSSFRRQQEVKWTDFSITEPQIPDGVLKLLAKENYQNRNWSRPPKNLELGGIQAHVSWLCGKTTKDIKICKIKSFWDARIIDILLRFITLTIKKRRRH